ncbi:MAG: proton-conducting transporter membrane subunit, partial [Candidatus Eremiobacterota bacterium]
FAFLWIAVEATTLASAPLIYFHRHRRSLEATWKYLLICSVGIALALLGNFFLVVAASHGAPHESPLLLSTLVARADQLDPRWLRLAFVLLLVGYGTKMGLAPLHTWLPDTHGEAPSVVSALLSGALLNCAFLGVLRGLEVLTAAGQQTLGHRMLVVLGLLSMLTAAIFIVTQRDFKRMLAYSSIEHMGILAIGVGLGAWFGALLHAFYHSLTKAMMFMVAGNVMETYQTRKIAEVSGVMRVLPVSGALWLAGFFAITGTPPFAPFTSQMIILRVALERNPLVAVLYLILLGLVFVGMARVVLGMTQGPAPATPAPRREPWATWFSPLILAVLLLALGLWPPTPLQQALLQATPGGL